MHLLDTIVSTRMYGAMEGYNGDGCTYTGTRINPTYLVWTCSPGPANVYKRLMLNFYPIEIFLGQTQPYSYQTECGSVGSGEAGVLLGEVLLGSSSAVGGGRQSEGVLGSLRLTAPG